MSRSISRVLIANRGEIAARICRAVREEGMTAVAVFEEADRESGHLFHATETVCIGEGPLRSYLDVEAVVAAAVDTGCEAVHPGYGFLSENPELSAACARAGIAFVGPKPETMKALGDKVTSRRLAEEAGIPVVPASGVLPEGDEGLEQALSFGRRIGYPLMLKAVSGGGGRGIRRVENERELSTLLSLARKEARSGFGDARVYLEKCVVRPVHIEVQVLGDPHGNIIHLGTRNCSVQRRHQKLFEVAPAGIEPRLEADILSAALAFAGHVGYVSAGTVEFLADREGRFYFMEMNPRLQVEHTVTELYTGIDIVRAQLAVAKGKPLPVTQKDIVFRGCAIEARINAENPAKGFAPEQDKTIATLRFPTGNGLRLDTAVYPGYRIPGSYDSLIAKLAVYGFTWDEALSRMRCALEDVEIEGVYTTIPLFERMVRHPAIAAGSFDTELLSDHPELIEPEKVTRDPATGTTETSADNDDASWDPEMDDLPAPPEPSRVEDGGTVEVRAFMSGMVEEVLVKAGDRVEEGTPLAVIEAMKVFCNVESTADGVVLEMAVTPGQQIKTEDLLARIQTL